MARKASDRGKDQGAPLGRRSHATRDGSVAGPQLAFAGAVLLGFAVCGASKAMLPSDLVMPLVASAFLVIAAALGLVAWRHRGMDPRQVTYTDVVGALTLIGVFAAAAIEPEQMVRLVESR